MKKNLPIFFMMIAVCILAAISLAACSSPSQSEAASTALPLATLEQPVGDYEGDVTCIGQEPYEEAPVDTNAHVTGAQNDFAVTISVFNDFACEECLQIAQALDKVLELYPYDVRLVFRSFPDTSNQRSVVAAKVAEAAGLQGKFWDVYNMLYGTQAEWLFMDETTFQDWIWPQVSALGVDLDQFAKDINGEQVSKILVNNLSEAVNYSSMAPIILVDGNTLPQYIGTVGDFLLYLETLMIPYGRHLRNVQYSYCPPMTIDPEATYTATVVTDQGNITIALYPDIAPYAVNDFIFLAQEDYYDNTPFYAAIDGFIAQAGDPSGTGWGTPGYMFSTEISDQTSFDKPGMVAMGNATPNLVNSQFFITYSPLTFLDGQYTIFGEVIDGMEVLGTLTPRDPEVNPLLPLNNYILDVIITEK